MSTKNVCRCPACGSTKAHYDAARSKGGTFMTCPSCGHEGLYDAFEVSRDWFVEIDLDGPMPATLPPQTREQRAAADASAKWLVMSHDSYAREDSVVAECGSEDEAKRIMAERQRQPNADHMWIVKAGS